jgi:hypothetical protein
MRAARAALAALLLAAAPLGTGAAAVARLAEAMPVPVSLQLPLILKILTYDRNLATRSRGELRVAVVVAAGEAVGARAEIAEGFRALADHTVRGLRLRTAVVEYASEAQLEAALRAGQVTVVYVAPGNAGHLDVLVRVARAQQIVTTTGVPEYVAQGIAVGIGVQQDRPQILINLAASRSAGRDFDASLLRIVRIVR